MGEGKRVFCRVNFEVVDLEDIKDGDIISVADVVRKEPVNSSFLYYPKQFEKFYEVESGYHSVSGESVDSDKFGISVRDIPNDLLLGILMEKANKDLSSGVKREYNNDLPEEVLKEIESKHIIIDSFLNKVVGDVYYPAGVDYNSLKPGERIIFKTNINKKIVNHIPTCVNGCVDVERAFFKEGCLCLDIINHGISVVVLKYKQVVGIYDSIYSNRVVGVVVVGIISKHGYSYNIVVRLDGEDNINPDIRVNIIVKDMYLVSQELKDGEFVLKVNSYTSGISSGDVIGYVLV